MDTKRHSIPEAKCVWLRNRQTGLAEVIEIGRRHHGHTEPELMPHVHAPNLVEILYLHKGRKVLALNRRWYTLRGGDALVIPPSSEHKGRGPREERGLLYWIKLRLPKKGASFMGLSRSQSAVLRQNLICLAGRQLRTSPEMRSHIEGMIRSALGFKKDPLASLRIRTHLAMVIMDLLERADRTQPSRAGWLSKVLEAIDRHPGDRITVTGLAALTNLSVSAFERGFRARTGFSPADYILRHRITLAESRLADGRQSVTDIAYSLGFSSSQYFATVFQKYTGMKPTEYRNRGRSALNKASH